MTSSKWAKRLSRDLSRLSRLALRASAKAMAPTLKATRRRQSTVSAVQPAPGFAVGLSGLRRYRIFRPPGTPVGQTLPLIVMLHGCQQDAASFAASTRMNLVAARERFLVLYPEQDRLSNAQGCWNWYDTKSGRAQAEADSIMMAIDQVCVSHGADRHRVSVAGLSAGASMAAFLVTRYPTRFSSVTMHSGIPPGSANSSLSAVRAMAGRPTTRPIDITPDVASAGWPPLQVIHGGRDAIVSIRNARAAVKTWSSSAGANAGPTRELSRGLRYPMTVTDYKRRGSLVATLIEIDRLGHAWSGGSERERFGDSQGPDASRMVWRFAVKQFVPGGPK